MICEISKMKLFTHNLLQCNRKQCSGGFPLRIVLKQPLVDLLPRPAPAEDYQLEDSFEGVRYGREFDPEFVKAMLQKVEWDALRSTVQELGASLPESVSPTDLENEDFLKTMHDTLFMQEVVEADLVCPQCARVFNVSSGIPNMLLNDTEI